MAGCRARGAELCGGAPAWGAGGAAAAVAAVQVLVQLGAWGSLWLHGRERGGGTARILRSPVRPANCLVAANRGAALPFTIWISPCTLSAFPRALALGGQGAVRCVRAAGNASSETAGPCSATMPGLHALSCSLASPYPTPRPKPPHPPTYPRWHPHLHSFAGGRSSCTAGSSSWPPTSSTPAPEKTSAAGGPPRPPA